MNEENKEFLLKDLILINCQAFEEIKNISSNASFTIDVNCIEYPDYDVKVTVSVKEKGYEDDE